MGLFKDLFSKSAAPASTSRGHVVDLVLRPPAWGSRARAGQPITTAICPGDDESPLITVTVESGGERSDAQRSRSCVDDVFLVNEGRRIVAERRLPIRLSEPVPGAVIAKMIGLGVASASYVPEHLRRLSEALGAPTIVIGVPSADALVAAALHPSNGNALLVVEELTMKVFREARAEGISPRLFVVEGGRVRAVCELRAIHSAPSSRPPSTPRASLPPEPATSVSPIQDMTAGGVAARAVAASGMAARGMAARCMAEIDLYLDMNGYTAERKVAGTELVTVQAVRLGETTPRTFEFRMTNDPGPSELLDPGELYAWARFLAKRAPLSAAACDPAERERVRRELTQAIRCVDEVLAFIPPGQCAVPKEAFRTGPGRRAYSEHRSCFERELLHVQRDAYCKVLQSYPHDGGGRTTAAAAHDP